MSSQTYQEEAAAFVRSANGFGTHEDWRYNSKKLTNWAAKCAVNRSDCRGGYYEDKAGKKKITTRKAADEFRDGSITEAVLQKHFSSIALEDRVGVHSTRRDEQGQCWSKWLGIDIDCHDDTGGDPEANLRAAIAWYAAATALGFHVLLIDSNGAGGFHLWIFFSEPVQTRIVFTFGRWLVRDWEEHGLEKQPEVFPKQPEIGEGGFGNWLRLPGPHHSRSHFSRVWDGSQWLEDSEAI
jgi:hypothetical protein